MDNAKNAPETVGPSRRTVLLGAGSAGAVALLAACASPSGPASGAPQSAASSSSGTVPGGTDLGPATDIPVGGGKVFPQQETVVTQPTAGQFKAFTAICTHMQCTVGSVANGTINCPCHGSQYSITDGSVVRGPAPLPLAAKTVAVTAGDIHVS
jgi:Rieske Fe-S protein